MNNNERKFVSSANENSLARIKIIYIKNFVKTDLRVKGDPVTFGFVNTVVEFINAAYYEELKVGDPKYHNEIAEKKAENAGLSEEEKQKAKQYAKDCFNAYKYLVSISSEIPNPQTLEIIERHKKKAKGAKITHPVEIEETPKQIRKKAKREPAEKQDVIQIKMEPYILKQLEFLIGYANFALSQNTQLQDRMGAEKYCDFSKNVIALLNGEVLSREKLIDQGFNIEELTQIQKKAQALLNNFRIEQIYIAHRMQNPILPKEVGVFTRGGTDPHEFIGELAKRKTPRRVFDKRQLLK